MKLNPLFSCITRIALYSMEFENTEYFHILSNLVKIKRLLISTRGKWQNPAEHISQIPQNQELCYWPRNVLLCGALGRNTFSSQNNILSNLTPLWHSNSLEHTLEYKMFTKFAVMSCFTNIQLTLLLHNYLLILSLKAILRL